MICPLCNIDDNLIYDQNTFIVCEKCFELHYMCVTIDFSKDGLFTKVWFEGVCYSYDQFKKVLKLKAFL